MSGQHSQGTSSRMLKSSPKQGPLKATIPITSVMKQSSNFKSSNSTTVSPTYCWKNKCEPSAGQRSPGSSSYKEKSKNVEVSNSIRRAASLDTIYLKGHWPRDTFYWHTRTLQLNKSTQTDESDCLDPKNFHCISESEQMDTSTIREKPRTTTKDQDGKNVFSSENTLNSSSQTLSSCILSPTIKANPMPIITMKPLPKSSFRNSIEGLNQEIERIVLKTDNDKHTSMRQDYFENMSQVTPEGHRAPLAELLRTTRSRSVNTQTPQELAGSGCHSSGNSQGSTPDQEETNKLGSSPQLNKFLAREPPDGCEKVQSKSLNNSKRCPPLEHVPQLCTFKLKPSLGSAFQILQPNARLAVVEQDSPIVPSRCDDK